MDTPTFTYLDGDVWLPVVAKAEYDRQAQSIGATTQPTVLVYVDEYETFDVVPKVEYEALLNL